MEGTRREDGKPTIPKDDDDGMYTNHDEDVGKTKKKTDGHSRVIRGKYTNTDRPLNDEDDFAISKPLKSTKDCSYFPT